MSNQANTHAAWNDTKNFWTRQVQSVSVEERDLLEDWEFVLCDPVALKETVALRPRLQRCFKRVDSLLTERGEAVKKKGLGTYSLLCEAGTCYNFRCRRLPGYFLNATVTNWQQSKLNPWPCGKKRYAK